MQVTPGLNVEMELPTATPQAASSVQGSCAGSLVPPPLNFHVFSLHSFDIDWCQYTVRYLDTPTVTGASSELTPPPSAIAKPTADGTSLALIVIVVLVGVV